MKGAVTEKAIPYALLCACSYAELLGKYFGFLKFVLDVMHLQLMDGHDDKSLRYLKRLLRVPCSAVEYVLRVFLEVAGDVQARSREGNEPNTRSVQIIAPRRDRRDGR